MTAREIRPLTPEPPDVLGVTYHVAYAPIPPGIPQLGDVLPFVVSRIDHRDYLPAGEMVDVTVRPAWRAPAPEGEPRERCPHTDPGIPSINHPETPTAPPWQCVHDAGHEGSHSPVHCCDKRVRGLHYPGPWQCVRALDHDGDCTPPSESRHIPKPLRECNREELISAAALAFTNQDIAERDKRELTKHALRWERRVGRIAAYALSKGRSPHGNNHKPFCWLKSAHCLAFAILGSGGLDSAEADMARGPETS